MKVWVNLNVTFDLGDTDVNEAWQKLREHIAHIVTEDLADSISFKSGEDTPLEDRKSYRSYSES